MWTIGCSAFEKYALCLFTGKFWMIIYRGRISLGDPPSKWVYCIYFRLEHSLLNILFSGWPCFHGKVWLLQISSTSKFPLFYFQASWDCPTPSSTKSILLNALCLAGQGCCRGRLFQHISSPFFGWRTRGVKTVVKYSPISCVILDKVWKIINNYITSRMLGRALYLPAFFRTSTFSNFSMFIKSEWFFSKPPSKLW